MEKRILQNLPADPGQPFRDASQFGEIACLGLIALPFLVLGGIVYLAIRLL
jgi:hypothetical protein